jgi:hypothetical protein
MISSIGASCLKNHMDLIAETGKENEEVHLA